jgi:hypothetical protein
MAYYRRKLALHERQNPPPTDHPALGREKLALEIA